MCRYCLDPRYKLYYTPLEAAIRWCGLFAFEKSILRTPLNRVDQLPVLFPQWPCLSSHVAIILDAIKHQELPSTTSEFVISGPPDNDLTRLRIRHHDLRAWMRHYQSDQKPTFLFVSDAVQTESVKFGSYLALKAENDNLLNECRKMSATMKELQKTRDDPEQNHDQARKLFKLIGMLLNALLNTPASVKNKPSFASQDAISTALAEQHGGYSGLGKRTIDKYFSIANRELKRE